MKKLNTNTAYLSQFFNQIMEKSFSEYTQELRIQYAGRPVRAFFAFDPVRQAIVLCAGDKSNDKTFYEKLIRIADDEFTRHLTSLEAAK